MRKIIVLIIVIAAAAGVYWYTSKDDKNSLTETIPSTDDRSVPADSTFEAGLPTKRWQLSVLNSKSGQTVIGGQYPQAIYIEFNPADNSYKGYAGCNTFSGKYEASGDYGFSFGPIASTKMACDYIDLEGAVFEAMRKAATWGIKGEQLVFTSEDGYTDLVYSRQ
ncbi:META domain-containing protein [bacterium]|nr:MAG: META domain-containing protein [bacterium]